MTTLLLFKTTDNDSKEIITLAQDPHYDVPSFLTIDGHNYEVRDRQEDGDAISYSLSDSAVPQD